MSAPTAASATLRFVVVSAIVAAAIGGVAFACVFPDGNIGAPCTRSADCTSNHVCEPLDPARPGGSAGAVCLPMTKVDAPVTCTSNDDCLQAGFPVDATCDSEDALGACGGHAPCCQCPLIGPPCEIGFVIDPVRCTCNASPDAGVDVDGGEPASDGGF